MAANAKAVAIYLRVSSDDQDHRSQKNDLRLAAARYRGRILWFTDVVSGAAELRPGLDQLGKHIAAGKVERVIVWALDRLSRRGILDGLERLKAWVAKDVVVESLKEPWVAATADPNLRELLLSIAFWGAAQQRQRIIECTRAGLRAAKARGVVLGRHKGDIGHKWNPAKRKVDVALAHSLRTQGVPVSAIAVRFHATRAAVYYALRTEVAAK